MTKAKNPLPLVSVCCLAYNHEQFIRQAVDSFLMQQTSFPIEIIIHDDASTDRTAEIIKEYEEKHPDLIVGLYQSENQYQKGVKISRSIVWPKAKGKYIALCEGDDYWTDPKKLQKQIDFLEAHEQFTSCFAKTATLKGNVLFENEHRQYYSKIMGERTEFSIEDIVRDNFIATCSVVFRKMDMVYPDWYDALPFGDWALHVLNATRGKIKYIDEVMAVYRVHNNGIWNSKSTETKQQNRFDFLRLINAHLEKKYDDIILRSISETAMEYQGYSSRLEKALTDLEGRYQRSLFLLKEVHSKLENSLEENSNLKNEMKETNVHQGKEIVIPSDNLTTRITPSVNERRKILLALPFTVIGGADTILVKIFSSLKNEYDISVITTLESPVNSGDTTSEYQKITQDIYHLTKMYSDPNDRKQFIHQLIDTKAIDLLFIVGSEFVYGMLPEIKKRHRSMKVIDQLFNEFGHIENNRRFNTLIDFNILASEVIRDVLINTHHEKADKMEVVVHGVDVHHQNNPESYANRENPIASKTKGKFVISFFGRCSSEKAPEIFVEIIAKLRSRNIQGVMTGDGPMYAVIKEFISKNHLDDLIYAPGFVDDIKPLMMASDVVVVPSRIEGLPIVILESLSMGIPVIASNIGGISTVVNHGVNGYLCEPAHADDFVRKILTLYHDRNMLSHFKKNARDFAVKNISEERMNASYKRIVDAVVNAPVKSNGQPGNGSEPLVSVVIPCYRQSHFLKEAVESVVQQTYTNWECIIVNDGSPDDTSDVVRNLIKEYPGHRISLVEKKNGGLSSARNAGFRSSHGEFVLPLDADDKIKPSMIAKLVTVMEKNPAIGFAYGHIQHFGAVDTEFPLPDFDRNILIQKDNICCVCSLIRMSVWQQTGGYNESMQEGYEDWDFWISCVEKGWEGYCLHEPLFCYRKSSHSMLSDANTKRERLIAAIILNHPALYDEKSKAMAAEIIRVHKLKSSPDNSRNGMKEKLRITYLISSILGVTGGNQTLLKQSNAMVNKGHHVTIVTYTDRPAFMPVLAQTVKVPAGEAMSHYVPDSDVVVGTYFLNALELKNISAPVKVYFAQGDQFVFEDSSASLSAAQRKQLQEWKQLSQRSYLQDDVKFIANSRNLAGAVEKQYGRKADAIVPVCVDQTIFRPLQRSYVNTQPRILIVGPDTKGSAMEPLTFKGIGDILVALEKLRKNGVEFTAVRMSNSQPEIFKNYPCEFYAVPSDELKTFLYGTATILVYASHYDSCPIPPLEAMAAGAAVVCTASDGAKEYCRDEENCLLVPIQSPDELCKAIDRLLSDEALREKVIRGGFATAKQFPREREWNEMEQLFGSYVHSRQQQKTTISTEAKHHLDSIRTLFEQREWAKSLDAVRTFQERFPECWQENGEMQELLAQFKGMNHLNLQQLEEAKAAFEFALSVNPKSSDACCGLGEVLYLAEMDEASKTMFEWAVVNDPDNITARKGLVKVNKALQLSVSDNSLLDPRIGALIEQAEDSINHNDIQEALAILVKVSELDRYHLDALNDLSVCYIIQKDITKAVEIISLILSIDPGNETAQENLRMLNEQTLEIVEDCV